MNPIDKDTIARALQMLSTRESNPTDVSDAQQIAGKYIVHSILGCDGQATVALAQEPTLRRNVVLKIYHDALTPNQRNRIVNEGRALSQINSPHVVQCFGVEESEGVLFLVLEYIEGISLTEFLAKHDLSTKERLLIFRQIVLGIRAANRNGLLHLDLKPANVLVTKNRVAKVIDFGLVRSVESEGNTGEYSGTPAYMAPEVANGDSTIVETTDVFGLGGILYFMFSGVAPFDAKTKQEQRQLAAEGQIPTVDSYNATIPSWVSRMCMTCLAKHPSDRFATAQDLLDEVDSHSQKGGSAWVVALVGLLIAVATGFWFFNSGTNNHEPLTDTSQRQPYDFRVDEQKLNLLNAKVYRSLAHGEWDEATALQEEALEVVKSPPLAVAFQKEHELRLRFIAEGIESLSDSDEEVFQSAVASVFKSLAKSASGHSLLDEEIKEAQNAIREMDDLLGANHVFAMRLKHLFWILAREASHNVVIDPTIEMKDRLNLTRNAQKLLGLKSALALNSQFDIASLYRSLNNPVRSRETLERIIEITENETGYPRLITVNALQSIAVGEASRDPLNSLKLFERSERIANDELGENWSPAPGELVAQFSVFVDCGHFASALKVGHRCLEELPNDHLLLSKVWSRLALVYAEMDKRKVPSKAGSLENRRLALEFIDKAIKHAKTTYTRHPTDLGEVQFYVSQAAFELGQYQAALSYAKDALASYSVNATTQDYIFDTKTQIIRFAVEAGEDELSFQTAKSLFKQRTGIRGNARRRVALRYIACGLFEGGDYKNGQVAFSEAKELSKSQLILDPLNKSVWTEELRNLESVEQHFLSSNQ